MKGFIKPSTEHAFASDGLEKRRYCHVPPQNGNDDDNETLNTREDATKHDEADGDSEEFMKALAMSMQSENVCESESKIESKAEESKKEQIGEEPSGGHLNAVDSREALKRDEQGETEKPHLVKGLGFQYFSLGWDLVNDVIRVRGNGFTKRGIRKSSPKKKPRKNSDEAKRKGVRLAKSKNKFFAVDRQDGSAIEMIQTNQNNNRPRPGDTLGIFLDGKTRTLHLFRNGNLTIQKNLFLQTVKCWIIGTSQKLDLVPAICLPGKNYVSHNIVKHYMEMLPDENFRVPSFSSDSDMGVSGVEILGFRSGFYYPKMTFCEWTSKRERIPPLSESANASNRVSMIHRVKSYEGGWYRGQFHGRDCTMISWPLENGGNYQLDRSRGRFAKGLRRGPIEHHFKAYILVNGKSKRAGPPRRSEDDYCEIKYLITAVLLATVRMELETICMQV